MTDSHYTHLSFTGTLSRHAEKRVLPCDTTGHNRHAVCMELLVDTPGMGRRPTHATQYFDDAQAAETRVKAMRKGAVVTVHLSLCSLRLAGIADFVELQAPAPEPAKPATAANQPPIN